MKNGLNKFIKGVFAIFTIKLIFLGLSFTIQSCNNDNDFYENGELTNLKELNDFYYTAKNVAKNINEKLNASKKSKSISSKDLSLENNQQIDAELQVTITPLIQSGLDLLTSYGFSNQKLMLNFGSLDSPNIAIVSFAIFEAEVLAKEGYVIEDLDPNIDYDIASILIGSQNVYAQSMIGSCVLEALGVNAVIKGFKGGLKKLGKKGALKLFGKVASRYLGWVGAAIAIVDFADCMGAFNSEEISTTVPFQKDISCDDLVRFRVKGNSFLSVYIYKGDINYISDNDFHITSTKGYASYLVNFGDVANPECNIWHENDIILGTSIDQSTIESDIMPQGLGFDLPLR
ncbi:hypothetical protein BWZ22_02025 [Seonamhaeicola sp. S2-3]|uniref:hypothetical protein n=1 Tax=Seonamhaeicola sp. S2-3 TaxID=1936081 RepID=UPI000972A88B|nr:hypothetical protein [Seonamhaeicola sp. S2-3]APY10086.1 hypothetical protein BWZ22_02025 [Seonamhaeicola sp. S2-3]